MSAMQSFLKFISFNELDKWYVSYYLNPHTVKSKYKLIKLENIIEPLSIRIKKNDYDGKLSIVSKISFKDGIIHLRENNTTGMDLYYVPKNELLVSKINFHQGAIAVNYNQELVSSTHYQPYKINYQIVNAEFLTKVLRSNGFLNFIKYLRADGIKNEATYEFIKNLKIPLPSLQQQEEILKKYNAKIELAKQQEQEAKEVEESIEEYLFEELGIEKVEVKKEKSGLQFVKFKDIDRWDTQYLIGNIPSIKSKYDLELFSNAIACFNKDKKGKSLRINSKNFPEDKFLYIGMEHIEKETGTLLEQNIVFGKEIKSQTLRVPREFILYGKLRPYLNKYWINYTEKDNIICSSEFFVFDIDENINKLYFKYCLSSSFIQQQISDKTSGARMPRINEDIFMNLKFPLPLLNIQEKIANEITKRKEKIKQLKQEAQKNREEAIKEFEREIFDEA